MTTLYFDLFLTWKANPRYNKEEKGKAGTCSRKGRDKPGKGRNIVLHMLWKLTKEASRYKGLYLVAILSTFLLTLVNLAAPRLLSEMTGVVEAGVTERSLVFIFWLSGGLLALYCVRVLFRFLSNYLAHKAAWYLVGDLRSRLYAKLQTLDMGFFHDKQTGDLMSRVVNDTRDFELLYAHMIPELITNLVTFGGVLLILLTINSVSYTHLTLPTT